jgi:glycolate oxidase
MSHLQEIKRFESCTPQLLTAFESIVGPEHVLTAQRHAPDDYARYGRDHTEDFQFSPDVVLRPANADEVSRIMRLCHEHHLPVTPRGAGTGLSGGALPAHGGVVISTERLNRIWR